LRPAGAGVGHPPRVAGEHRHHAGRQRGRQRRAKRDAAEEPQHRVGVDGRREQRAAQDDDQHPCADHEAVAEGLGRDVDLPERRHLAEAREHGEAVADDERVDDRDEEGQRHRVARRARDLTADAGPGGRAEGGDR
jgi:hypothetical protein